MNSELRGYEKNKAEFLKKKSAEKFDFLYEKFTDLEDEIERKEECLGHDCSADENSDWIEKIKFEQHVFLEDLDDLRSTVNYLDEQIKKIIKILKLEKKIEDYDEQKIKRGQQNFLKCLEK